MGVPPRQHDTKRGMRDDAVHGIATQMVAGRSRRPMRLARPSDRLGLSRLTVGGPEAIYRYLLPGEDQIITVRQHPAALIESALQATAGLVAAVVLTVFLLPGKGAIDWLVWIAWALLFFRALQRAVNWVGDFFVVTSQRMLMATGTFSRKVAIIPFALVYDLSFQRSFGGRVFGYGEFIVQYGFRDQLLQRIQYIPYPEQLYLEICRVLFPDFGRSDEEEPGEAPARDEDA
jgi:hypothetical protein